jgi:hypothetical protein
MSEDCKGRVRYSFPSDWYTFILGFRDSPESFAGVYSTYSAAAGELEEAQAFVHFDKTADRFKLRLGF